MGAPAARGCSIDERKVAFLGDLPLRRAARLMGGRWLFWGAPAARGCSIDGRREVLLGGSRCAGLLD